jgi:hypothetical protein
MARESKNKITVKEETIDELTEVTKEPSEFKRVLSPLNHIINNKKIEANIGDELEFTETEIMVLGELLDDINS